MVLTCSSLLALNACQFAILRCSPFISVPTGSPDGPNTHPKTQEKAPNIGAALTVWDMDCEAPY